MLFVLLFGEEECGLHSCPLVAHSADDWIAYEALMDAVETEQAGGGAQPGEAYTVLPEPLEPSAASLQDLVNDLLAQEKAKVRACVGTSCAVPPPQARLPKNTCTSLQPTFAAVAGARTFSGRTRVVPSPGEKGHSRHVGPLLASPRPS